MASTAHAAATIASRTRSGSQRSAASTTSPPARDYYARKRLQGKKHNAAILCLARRRCDLIHKMLLTGQSYRELPHAGKTGDLPLDALA
jgi:hypothetical protein